MKKIKNIIITILMIIIGIGIAVAEAYYIIVKNGFGMNVFKYTLCGIVCYIGLSIICFILSLFIRTVEHLPYVEEKVVARIYNNKGNKIGEIRK